jgi:hypothetical protein
MSENSPEDWRQASKGRRAVTQTDERRVTPVRNQFQELSEQQDASDTGSTPRPAPREPIAAFSRLPPEDDNTDIPEDNNNAETGSIGSTDTQIQPEDNDGDNSNNDDNTETGSIGSTESFDTMTDITNDYGSLIKIIRYRQRQTSKSLQRKEKELRRHRKIPRSPRQRPLDPTMLRTSWWLFLASRQGSRPQTTTNRGAPTDQWRTWTFWCHTYGANLTHISNACSRPKDGHKTEATQRNPMGGNSKRDYLTGQWCNSVTNSPQATPTTAA